MDFITGSTVSFRSSNSTPSNDFILGDDSILGQSFDLEVDAFLVTHIDGVAVGELGGSKDVISGNEQSSPVSTPKEPIKEEIGGGKGLGGNEQMTPVDELVEIGGTERSTPVSTPVPDNCEVMQNGDWLCGTQGTDIPYVESVVAVM